jgi:PAS domain S-box-containing protein
MIQEYVLDLRRGLESGEIVPYYQPQIELRTEQLIGFEVLARWKHPLRGMVPPDEFIRTAEDAGYIGQLMEKVLGQAFATLARLPDYLRMSINVSAIQLRDSALQRQVSLAAEQTGFSLERLTVEITESALVGNIEHARTITEELKQQGVRLAIDDFGTGYSSLRHLHALPFDEIKVDRTFVRTLLTRRESRKIVAAILGLGQSLGLTSVAEGVEEESQADMLQWLGCDVAQGYLYGRPVANGRLQRFVQEQKLIRRRPAGRPANIEDVEFESYALPNQRLSQLQVVYDEAPVGLCFVDRNERYVSLNKRQAELNHAPIKAHLGRTVQEMIPEFYVYLEPYIKRALNGESFQGLEFTATVAGEMQVRSTSYHPARDEGGEVVGISVAVLDVTDRTNTQVALKESEEHYRHAIRLNPQIAWTADAEGMVTEASPQWTALTGLSERQSKGWGWSKVLHPEDAGRVAVDWKRSIDTGEPVDMEYRIRNKKGRWQWIRARAAARLDADGRIMRWYGWLEDIDEQKRARAELEERVAKMEAIFDAMAVGIVVVDAPVGRVVMSNRQADAMLGGAAAEMMTSGIEWELFDRQGRRVRSTEHPVKTALSEGRATEMTTYDYRGKDGSSQWLGISAAPLQGIDGHIIGGVITIQRAQGIHEVKTKVERIRA